ncbi:MAG: magnesium transporter MgtE [Rhodothalassiaceae bacterium]|nr:MAG: magnesium transporter MgtE [Rhodothalassiaceae bacterium]
MERMNEEVASTDRPPAPPARDSGEEDLRREQLARLREALEADDRAAIEALFAALHPADAAELIELLDGDERRHLARLMGGRIAPEILAELDGTTLEELVAVLPERVVARALAEMDTDDAIQFLEELDEDEQRRILARTARRTRAEIESGLSFPEDSAGRLMRRDLVAMPEFWNVGQAIDFLRGLDAEEGPEEFYEIFVVNPQFRPVGTVPLWRLLRSPRPTPLKEIMTPDPPLFPVTTDQEEVALAFTKYHLISAGVVDDNGRLIGRITADDVVEVIGEEAEEDILALAGVSESDLNQPIREVTRERFIWLVINLGTAILASLVIGLFEATIQQMVALAVLMPIVASMGGNAGTQTMTVTVRALATRELTALNALKVARRELLVAFLNGCLLALVTGAVTYVWFWNPMLALVIGLAMVVNLVAAGLAGIFVPLALDRLGIDPAVASSVFVTTVTDVVGFFAFLALGGAILL